MQYVYKLLLRCAVISTCIFGKHACDMSNSNMYYQFSRFIHIVTIKCYNLQTSTELNSKLNIGLQIQYLCLNVCILYMIVKSINRMRR